MPSKANGVNGAANRGHYIIIGAGFGGLTTAIELRRKGISVQVIEAANKLTLQGDIIQIPSNATRVISKWGNVMPKIIAQSSQPKKMSLFNHTGQLILDSPLPSDFDGFPILFSNRGWSQTVLYEKAVELGVEFQFGTRVESYFEDDNCAGVYADGERLTADGIIGADGVHSKARKYVTGKKEHPRTSGFAVYRAWFSLSVLGQDARTRHFTELKEDLFQVWIGPDVHAMLIINVALQGVTVFCTHKDYYEVEECWNFPGDRADMLKVVDGWDETIRTVISLIPPEILIDWKLLWRDPVRKWVSDKGRVVLIGDAAHPHLPTSGSGAAQAIEDGATLGVLLDKLGKSQVPLAFKAFEKLRYERTSLTQRLGWETRHRWHQTDWDFVKSHPEFLKMPMPQWLYGSDPEQYTCDRMDDVIKSIEDGMPFVSTNVPEEHVHEDWTVETMMALEGKQVEEQFYKIATN